MKIYSKEGLIRTLLVEYFNNRSTDVPIYSHHTATLDKLRKVDENINYFEYSPYNPFKVGSYMFTVYKTDRSKMKYRYDVRDNKIWRA